MILRNINYHYSINIPILPFKLTSNSLLHFIDHFVGVLRSFKYSSNIFENIKNDLFYIYYNFNITVIFS